MKNKIFKKLNEEIEGLSLPMSAKLKNEPIHTKSPDLTEIQAENKKTNIFDLFGSKRLKAVCAAAAVMIVAGCGVLGYFGISSSLAVQAEECLLYLDINPSIAVALNGDKTVKKIVSCNDDGDTLICNTEFMESLIGAPVGEAVAKLSERAAKMGYLDVDNEGTDGNYNEIKISVYGSKKLSQDFAADVGDYVTEYFCQSGVFVYVNTDISNVENIKTEISALLSRPQYYFDYATSIADENVKIQYSLDEFYRYTNNILSAALEKFDLYSRISELNEEIKQITGKSYWLVQQSEDITPIQKEMEMQLEKLYILYGDDYRSTSLLDAYINEATFTLKAEYFYETLTETAGELRILAESGLSEKNFGLSEITDFCFFAGTIGYAEELAAGLKNTAEELLTATQTNIDNAIMSLITFKENFAEDLYTRYSAYFEQQAKDGGITLTDYENFLIRIGKI